MTTTALCNAEGAAIVGAMARATAQGAGSRGHNGSDGPAQRHREQAVAGTTAATAPRNGTEKQAVAGTTAATAPRNGSEKQAVAPPVPALQ
jgi:hypothetical protein